MAKSSFFNGTGVSSNYVSDLEGITEESKEYRDAAAVSASQVAATATQIVSNVNIAVDKAADAQASAALAANSVSDAADSASQASASQTAAAVSAAAALVTEGQSSSHAQTAASSSTAAEASEVASAASAANSATSATQAETAKTVTEAAKDASLAALDSFDDRYLGAKSAAPTLDNDSDTLITGSLYFNSTTSIMNVYGSGGWQSAGSSVNGTSDRQVYTATAGQTVFAATYDTGYIDVYLNGVKLAPADFTATNGTSITLASGAAVNDILETVAYGTFALADHLTQTQSDARYVNLSGDTMTGDLGVDGNVRIGGSAISATITGLTQTNLVVGSATGGEIVAYRNDDTLAEGDFVGAFLFGNDDNNATEDHFAGTWATASGTGGSMDIKFAGQKGLYEAGTPQMILRSEGDLLVGTTSITNYNNNAGTEADDGLLYLDSGVLSVSSHKANANVGFVQYLNRTNTDGGFLDFRKDGVSVGNIGTQGGDLYVGTGDTTLKFSDADDVIFPTGTDGATRSGFLSLGNSSNKFKNLHLSGTLHLSDLFIAGNKIATNGTTMDFSVDDNTDGANQQFRWSEGGVVRMVLEDNDLYVHDNINAGRVFESNASNLVFETVSSHVSSYSADVADGSSQTYRTFIQSYNSTDPDLAVFQCFSKDVMADTGITDHGQKSTAHILDNGGRVFSWSSHYAGRVRVGSTATTTAYRAGDSSFTAYSGTGNTHGATNYAGFTLITGRETANTDDVFAAYSAGQMRIEFDAIGNGYFDGGADLGNADYAEYFEWADGNPDNEDRRGYSVVLTTDGKMRIATSEDDTADFLGIVSVEAAIVGDSAWAAWTGKYERDRFGQKVFEDYDLLCWGPYDEDAKSYKTQTTLQAMIDAGREADIPEDAITVTKRRQKLSANYDPDREYIARKDRIEWQAIGLMGKLPLIKGQPTAPQWRKLFDLNDEVEMWLVR
tara:strand:- start:237 stop:3101 length:2865 start_codon:yes stop_codon:yes gene_type:complete